MYDQYERHERRPFFPLIVGFALGILAVALFMFFKGDGLMADPGTNNQSTITSDQGVSVSGNPGLPGVSPTTISDIVTKVGPAVVKIDTEVQVTNRGVDPFFNDPFFRQFFGTPAPQTRIERGVGSGFIISKDGYILTNNHVVNGASKVNVTVTGYDKPFSARVVGSDYDLDLAVLKIDSPKDLPFVSMGDADQTKVGEWVIAIGNPYGLDHTVTVGVISAKGRPLQIDDRKFENLLQTDASINPGNSGGPLLNLQGQVIGINTAINAQAQGIGFAIPTNTVKSVLETLMTSGKISRPWLGVYIQDVTPDIAQYFGLDKAEGVLITDVFPQGPAAKAGLTRGDIMLELNKQKLKNTKDLIKAIESSKIGDKVMVLIMRDGQTRYVTIQIEEKPTQR